MSLYVLLTTQKSIANMLDHSKVRGSNGYECASLLSWMIM